MTARVARVAVAVILGVGGVAVAIWRLWGTWAVAPFVAVAVVAAVLSWIDLREHRLPNLIVVPAIGASVLLLLGGSLADGQVASWLSALIGGAALFGLYLVLALVSPRGMGMGDVKFAALIGLFAGYLGLTTWIGAALAGFIVGGGVAAISLVTRRATGRTQLPFGPSMVAGLWIAVALTA